jgi:hypothetical protein
MSTLKKYSWEATIFGVITTLTVVTHLIGTPPPRIHLSAIATPMKSPPQSYGAPIAADTSQPSQISSQPKPAHPPTSNPREVIVGPSGISNRYFLLSVDRRSLSATVDKLTVRLHVASLASENLVSPFSSDMLDITSPGLEPIDPKTSFHTPIPSGDTRNLDVVFNIPASLSLEKAALYIHYYNYQNQIPLNLSVHAGSD